jgi:predicted RNA-binding protein associated with RNAse of E/G family
VLNLCVDPDGSRNWKDEDEFAEAIRIGRVSETVAATIVAAGEAVTLRVEARA